jgi:hypothetical protein
MPEPLKMQRSLWFTKLASIFHEPSFPLHKAASLEKAMAVHTVVRAQQHHLRAIMFTAQHLNIGKQRAPNALAPTLLCDHDVFNEGVWLMTIHGVRAQIDQCGGAHCAADLSVAIACASVSLARRTVTADIEDTN